jgi:hypothetical protein
MRPEDQGKIIEWLRERITRLESSSNYSQIRPGVERLKTFTAELVEEWSRQKPVSTPKEEVNE